MENTLSIKKRVKKGFTLVELLVVIAILAILASVSVVGYLGFTDKANQSKAESELAQAETVLLTLQTEDVKIYDTTTTTQVNYIISMTVDSSTNTYTITIYSGSDKTTTATDLTSATLKSKVLDVAFTDLATLTGTYGVSNSFLTYTINGKIATSTKIKLANTIS